MADTILNGDFTVYYSAENNQKRLEWTGASTTTRTLNALYSALQNLFDDPAQMDDLVPIRADTPDIYRLQNQWFIDDTSVEHLTGGSIYSNGWITGSVAPFARHVIVKQYGQTTEFSSADIGRTIVGTTSADTGTILDFNTSRALVWIRPAVTSSGGDEFENETEAYTIQNDAVGYAVNEDVSGSTFVDQTADANEGTDNDVQYFPANSSSSDAFFVGFAQKFSRLRFDNATGTSGTGVGAGNVTWEYSQGGDVWASLAGVTDGTDDSGAFTNTLADNQTVTFTIPDDWGQDTVNGSAQLYYVRARISGGPGYTQEPVGSQVFVGGVGAGSFEANARHTTTPAGGESAWAGVTTIGTIQANTHMYIYQENNDSAAGSFNEFKVLATKGTADWWDDGQLDILVKVKEADSVFGQLPGSTPATAVASVYARQYSKTFSDFTATALATAGGNTVVPQSAGDDLNNTTGWRNLIWDNASTDYTLVDEELMYIVGDTTSGNIDAAFQDDDSTFTIETSDINNNTSDDVAVFPATEAVNDAFYVGKDNPFTIMVADIGIQGVSTDSATAWEYYDADCSAWDGVTIVSDNTNTGNGAWTEAAASRHATQWTIPGTWGRGGLTAAAVAALNYGDSDLYYIRIRISAANYTTVPALSKAFVAGEAQLRARVADTTITRADSSTGNTDYYLLGDPLTDFANNDVVVAGSSLKIFDVNGAPTDAGPASDSDIDVTSGAHLLDINNGNDSRPYSIQVDPDSQAILNTFERLKWLTRRGSTSDIDVSANHAAIGESYIGNQLQIEYGTQGGNYGEGLVITGGTTNARGVLVADHDDGTSGDLILRDVRGTFSVGETVTDSDTGTATIVSLRTIAPVPASPFGTFAGGTFFGAPGVSLIIANLATGDEQAYQLIDDDGVTQTPPNTRSVEVTNLASGDTVTMFRLDSDAVPVAIEKDEYSLAAANDLGNTTVVLTASVSTESPSDANSKLRIVSASNEEHRYRFDSFTTATITLSPASTGTGTANSTNTLIQDATGNFVTEEVEVGDYVRNTTDGVSYSIVTAVSSSSEILVTDNGTTWNAQAYSVNTLVENYTSDQNAYIPLIERIADAANETNTIVAPAAGSSFQIRVDVRNAGVILPFTQNSTITTTGRSIAAIRNDDDIFSS